MFCGNAEKMVDLIYGRACKISVNFAMNLIKSAALTVSMCCDDDVMQEAGQSGMTSAGRG